MFRKIDPYRQQEWIQMKVVLATSVPRHPKFKKLKGSRVLSVSKTRPTAPSNTKSGVRSVLESSSRNNTSRGAQSCCGSAKGLNGVNQSTFIYTIGPVAASPSRLEPPMASHLFSNPAVTAVFMLLAVLMDVAN